ncbi:hypothetical protein O181_110888, partial [Austropuccinia psidii MF-1]|nr:hypothetical protein [Austropuccinia psidii MF-1]
KREAFYRRRLSKKDEPGPRAFSVQALAAVSGSQEDSAILNSGASYSLFKSSARFISFKQAKIPLFLADGSCIYASGIGTAVVFNHRDEPLHLRNSLVVPSINSCLIALSPFLKKEFLLIGGREGSVGLQTKDGHTLLRGTISNNIIKVQLGNPNPNQVNIAVGADILHKCLGNPSTKSLLEKARCLLVNSNLPHEWWGEAMATSAYLLNRTPVASIGFKTPYELYLGQLPKTSHLHVFGCLTFVKKAKANLKSKPDPWASKAIFLGYAEGHKNYKVYNLETNRLQVLHYCVFLDEVMASAPSPKNKEFVLNNLPGGFQSQMVPSGAGTYPAQNLDPCDTFNLDAIFDNDTPRLLDNPSPDCNSNSEEDFVSFQKNPDPFVETPSNSVSTEPGKVDTPNLPKGWVMDLVPDKAPKDITSAIDTENIVSGTRRGAFRRTAEHLSSSHAPSKGDK